MMTATTLLKNTFVFFGLFFLSTSIHSATMTIKNTGTWTNTNTWENGIIPNSSDNVQLNNNRNITVEGSDNITIVDFNASNNATLIIESGGSLSLQQLTGGMGLTIIVRGTLLITGNVDFDNQNNLTITVDAGGMMMVSGDVAGKNGLSLTVNGTLNIGGDLSGEMGSTATGGGTITVGGTISGPASFTGAAILPVTLTSFNATSQSTGVLLNWASAAEINNDYYTVERSTDGIQFRILTKVKGAGNSFEPLDYQYLDQFPLARAYYRLSQTDFDGTKTVFTTIEITHRQSDEVQLFPTIIEDGTFQLSINENSKATDLVLFGQDARVYLRTQLRPGVQSINLPRHLASGTYIVQVLSGLELLKTERIILK